MSKRTAYHIIRLKVERDGQIIRFQQVLPAHFERCTGFTARVVDWFSPIRESGRFGTLALEFNGKKKLVVNTDVVYQPEPGIGDGMQPLEVYLQPGMPLTGYFFDKGYLKNLRDSGLFIPFYTIALYFKVEFSKKPCLTS